MKKSSLTPVLGIAAYSGTGKTTLLVKLIPLLAARGIRIGMIKHAHHNFDIDQKGKDSYELRKAGASQMLIGSASRWALIVETDPSSENTLQDLIQYLDHDNLDLVLVEGFKPENIPKIELIRPELGKPLYYPEDGSVIAVATDAELPATTTLPVLDLNNPEQIAEFILDYLDNKTQKRAGHEN